MATSQVRSLTLKLGLGLVLMGSMFGSCSKEEVGVATLNSGGGVSPIDTSSSSSCSQFTLIRPKVDFLFLWDNSGSQVYVNEGLKVALASTINSISTRFNYRITLAPIQSSGGQTYVIASDESELPVPAGGPYVKIGYNSAASALNSYSPVGGSQEFTFNRVSNVINSLRPYNAFRPNTYLFVVVMSNGDENYHMYNPATGLPYETFSILRFNQSITNSIANYRNIKNSLGSLQFRFISLISDFATSSGCLAEWKDGSSYRQMSTRVYSELNAAPYDPEPQLNSYKDTYSICTTSFQHLFDGINSSIQETVAEHKYNFWPVASTLAAGFDPGAIRVVKSTGQVLNQNDYANGFSLLPGINTRNTRYEPTAGEPYTGYLIQLYGNGRVTYPECLMVTTQNAAEYYGFVAMDKEPDVSTIQLTVNGSSRSQSASNGWTYVGYRSNQNVKLAGPTQSSGPGTPAVSRSGYFLQLNGSAIFSNGGTYNLLYKPKAL